MIFWYDQIVSDQVFSLYTYDITSDTIYSDIAVRYDILKTHADLRDHADLVLSCVQCLEIKITH